MNQKALSFRIAGFTASLVLTLLAYVLIVHPDILHLKRESALWGIFILAGLQSLVQLICFIDLWGEKGPPWNLGVFLSTAAIIFVVIAFSIWIMNHLNYNMMPFMYHAQ